VTAVLDSGALIGIDKRDRRVGAMLRILQRDGVPIRTSAGVVAQVWRDGRRQANLARVLSGVDIAALDDSAARNVGELLRANGTTDLVDAHIALLVQAEGTVVTSDEADIAALLQTRKVKAVIVDA
jgi:alkylated DNA nucleotide flippase Atl1